MWEGVPWPRSCHHEHMDESTLRALLDEVRSGTTTPDDAVTRLRRLPFADVHGASVDHHRQLRQGMPEAVYGPGKHPDHCVAIVGELLTLAQLAFQQVDNQLVHRSVSHLGRSFLSFFI